MGHAWPCSSAGDVFLTLTMVLFFSEYFICVFVLCLKNKPPNWLTNSTIKVIEPCGEIQRKSDSDSNFKFFFRLFHHSAPAKLEQSANEIRETCWKKRDNKTWVKLCRQNTMLGLLDIVYIDVTLCYRDFCKTRKSTTSEIK